VESPAAQNKKCRSEKEATEMSHRSAQAFYFASRLETKSAPGRPTYKISIETNSSSKQAF
jgi:hypothetical protein